MRLFAAVDLPQSLRDQIRLYTQTLERFGADIRWTPAENLHLTLKFFGQWPAERLEEVEKCLREAALLTKCFRVGLDALVSAFPDMRSPKVIWIGICEGASELLDLAHRIDDKTQALGVDPEERPFIAHLTIGRANSSKEISQLHDAMASVRLDRSETFEVSSLCLYESHTLSSGAVYQSIGSYRLMGKP